MILCLTTLVFITAGVVEGEIPDPDEVVRTLEGWRTSLRSAHRPGEGTAASPLHLVVFSLLQSWERRGHSGALNTLADKSGTVGVLARHQFDLLERSTLRPDQRLTFLTCRDTDLVWAATLSPPLRDCLGSLANRAGYLLAGSCGADHLAILEERVFSVQTVFIIKLCTVLRLRYLDRSS